MDVLIEPYAPQHRAAVVRLSLRAWAPVFASLEHVIDPAVYTVLHPDWRVSQQRAVEHICAAADAAKAHGWVPLVNPNTVKRILRDAGLWPDAAPPGKRAG